MADAAPVLEPMNAAPVEPTNAAVALRRSSKRRESMHRDSCVGAGATVTMDVAAASMLAAAKLMDKTGRRKTKRRGAQRRVSTSATHRYESVDMRKTVLLRDPKHVPTTVIAARAKPPVRYDTRHARRPGGSSRGGAAGSRPPESASRLFKPFETCRERPDGGPRAPRRRSESSEA